MVGYRLTPPKASPNLPPPSSPYVGASQSFLTSPGLPDYPNTPSDDGLLRGQERVPPLTPATPGFGPSIRLAPPPLRNYATPLPTQAVDQHTLIASWRMEFLWIVISVACLAGEYYKVLGNLAQLAYFF
jgi:hypothetical protein